jgi:hypothetical protein
MLRLRALAALLLVVAIPPVPALAQEQAKWFVLRNHEVGNCWTAVLIRIDGQYINTFAQKAGGPYDTEAEALQRLKVLEDQGTCEKQ